MKIVFISDTHTLHGQMLEEIPEGDVLVHCGDVSSRGIGSEIDNFLFWFSSLPHKNKIFIAGNHDFGFEYRNTTLQNTLESIKEDGIHYLQDSGIEIDGIKFWGSPWTPPFYNWAFMLKADEIKEKWEMIPRDTNVLITHGPPRGILDLVVYDQKNVGCPELMEEVLKLQDLKIHAFGHIHEEYGSKTIGENGPIFVNASTCTLRYKPWNKPIVIEIGNEESI
jgi:Icc-related predicted phosphoesterase